MLIETSVLRAFNKKRRYKPQLKTARGNHTKYKMDEHVLILYSALKCTLCMASLFFELSSGLCQHADGAAPASATRTRWRQILPEIGIIIPVKMMLTFMNKWGFNRTWNLLIISSSFHPGCIGSHVVWWVFVENSVPGANFIPRLWAGWKYKIIRVPWHYPSL